MVAHMTIKVRRVADDLEAVKAFLSELGLRVEGETPPAPHQGTTCCSS